MTSELVTELLIPNQEDILEGDVWRFRQLYPDAAISVSPAPDPGCFPAITPQVVEEQIIRLLSYPNSVGTKQRLPVAALPVSEEHSAEEYRTYMVPFSRDAILFALFLLDYDEQIAHDVVIALAEQQGIRDEPASGSNGLFTEEQKGRIPLELRAPDDPRALQFSRERQFGWPYFGSVDATPLFVILAEAYIKHREAKGDGQAKNILRESVTRRDGSRVSLAVCVDQALDWMRRRMTDSPDGLLETWSPNRNGAQHQGWRDSWDAFPPSRRDGKRAKIVAPLDVQALSYRALISGSRLAKQYPADIRSDADALRDNAQKVKETILQTFMVPGGEDKDGYLASAVIRTRDERLEVLPIRSSSMGWLLWAGMLDEGKDRNYRETIVNHLADPAICTRWGVRTVATEAMTFHPSSYHNGSIWLFENVLIAEGLLHYGYATLAQTLLKGIVAVVENTKLFPEYIRGDDTDVPVLPRYTITVQFPGELGHQVVKPPQPVQAWSVAAYWQAKHLVDAVLPVIQ